MDEQANATVRILIADDEPGVRHGLTIRLGSEDDLDIAGGAEDGQQVLEQVAQLRPDVVLMDVRMPRTDGVTATRLLRGAFPGLAIIVLSLHDDLATQDAAIAAGASAFVSKHDGDRVLLETIRRVGRGSHSRVPPSTHEYPIATETEVQP
ncbi:MAG: response regulator transcription factor [Nitriliruptoraceae bacterium]